MTNAVKIPLEGGGYISPKDSTEVYCETHNYRTTWGKLDGIQQSAVAESICTTADMRCLLKSNRKPREVTHD